MIIRPIKYVGAYLLFTLCAYIFVYFNTDENLIPTVLVVSIFYISLIAGYFFNTKKNNVSTPKWGWNCKIRKLIIFASFTTIIISFVNVLSYYPSFSVMMQYLKNPGLAYSYVKAVRRGTIQVDALKLPSIIAIGLNILTFTKYIVIIFLPLYWKKLKKIDKLLGLLSLFVYVIHAFLIGAMINIGICFFSLVPVLFYYSSKSISQIKLRYKILIFLLLGCSVLLIAYFLGSRSEIGDRSIENILREGFMGLMTYVSHGYRGLSYCLQLPFQCTWGQTTFYGIITKAFPFLGINSNWANSYLVRSQEQFGWSALQVWSTIFPWLASDVSFVFIPIIMFAIGYFIKKVWQDVVTTKNPYAFLMMSQLMVFCFMIPANNQLFHTFGNSMGTIIIFMMYRHSLKKQKKARRILYCPRVKTSE